MVAIVVGLLVWIPMNAQSDLEIKEKVEIRKAKAKIEEKCQLRKPLSMSPKNKFAGFIKDENDEPMIGATVLLDDDKGTVTDLNGRYELEIPKDWKTFDITYSYIGYRSQVVEFEKNDLRNNYIAEVQMQPTTNEIKEVVVVGYKLQVMCHIITCGGYCIEEVSEQEVKEEIKKESNDILSTIDVFPNPFFENLTVKLNIKKEARYFLHLYNMNGQLMWANTFSLYQGKQSLELNLGYLNLSAGNYFLRLTDGEKEIQTKKVIRIGL